MPPPISVAVLFKSVQAERLRVPALEMAPPAMPELLVNRQSCKDNVPRLTTALAVAPPIVIPVMLLVVPSPVMKIDAGFVTPNVMARSDRPGPEIDRLPFTGGKAEDRMMAPVAEIRIASFPAAALASRI